jgi:hypothetical protein
MSGISEEQSTVLTKTLRYKFEIQTAGRSSLCAELTCFLCSEPKSIIMNQSGPGTRSVVYLPATTMRPDSKISKGSSSRELIDVRTITSESADNVFLHI